MYFYIYDNFLTDRKNQRLLAEIETRLTDLGISGKIGRLSAFTTAKGLIRDEIRRGTQTIVVVGNDDTVSKVVESIGEVQVTLGMIPIGSPTAIAESLGIPYGVEACDVLSRRVTQKIDLGRVNGRYFLSSLRITNGNVVIKGDGEYRIVMPMQDCEVIVSNLRSGDLLDANNERVRISGDPMDGFLDALIRPRGGSFLGFARRPSCDAASVIPMRRLSITSDGPVDMIADGRPFASDNFEIDVVPECLRIITGRERVFA